MTSHTSNKLDGKVAVITGSTSGIGEEMACQLANRGAYVVIADIQDKKGHDIAMSRMSNWPWKAFLLSMFAGAIKGSIICMASAAASTGNETYIDYTMSKHAVLGLVRSASKQLGAYSIRVNCVSPGAVATTLLCRVSGVSQEEGERIYESTSSLKGVLKAKHVADAVAFLASEEAEFINGHNLAVDGGWAG
ncbi:hypothetical protein NL676_028888 [Syzygium grande]|nr:hypothetical protein NL676_028888 [Syzygium grande]